MKNSVQPGEKAYHAIIEAGNIRGLGSIAVCSALVPELVRLLLERGYRVTLVASSGLISRLECLQKFNLNTISIRIQKQTFAARILRLARYFYRSDILSCERLIVLGDLPYNTNARQTLFLQQPNMIAPRVNPEVGRGLKFTLMRLIFKINSRYCERIIIQTESMRQDALRSYLLNPVNLAVVRHVLPETTLKKLVEKQQSNKDDVFKLFYPASHYPHKNHQILWAAVPEIERLGLNVRFDLTISEEEIPVEIRGSKTLRCLGVLSPEDCHRHYYECDALFFPSKLESYGLPLMEALLGPKIPVLAADRPYARELCGSLAVFFDPTNSADLVAKLVYLLTGQGPEVISDGINRLPTLTSWLDMSKKMLD
jgi:glycosyltransferase involved in cell wall biosynthesis